jgi:hypothetical protein
MAYPPAQPINGIAQTLFPFKVNKEFYKQWIKLTPLTNLIGSEMNRPIYRHKLRDGEGLQFRVGRLDALDYKNPVVGLDQRRGTAQQQKVSEDRIDTKFQSFVVRLEGKDIVRLGTPIDLPSQVKTQLMDACQRNLNFELFNAMTTNIYPDIITQKPSYDRIITAGYSPDRATYNALGGLAAVLDGMTGSAPDQSGLSTKTFMKGKIALERGGQVGTLEHAIMPAFMKTRGGLALNNYYFLVNPNCLDSLYRDPLFVNTTLARGTILEADQPEAINGADYIGKYQGMHTFLCPELMNYELVSADGTKRVAWNIMMGAGAMTLGWHEFPFTVADTDEIERIQLFASHEQRGQKALGFPSKANPNAKVEQGIFHVFCQI